MKDDQFEDPYVYPGTSVLQNKLGIEDASLLRNIEDAYSQKRMSGVLPKIDLTIEGYQQLHKHIFQDVYEWAGEVRTVDLTKEGVGRFGHVRFLDRELENCFKDIQSDERLASPDVRTFIDAAAHHINEINARHPFREGNGRTASAFLAVLVERAGHTLALDRLDPDRWNEARNIGFQRADDRPMQELLREAIVPGRALSEAHHSDTVKERAQKFAAKEHADQTTRRSEEELKGPSIEQRSGKPASMGEQTVAERRRAAAATKERVGSVKDDIANIRSAPTRDGGGRGGGGRGR